MNHLAFGIRTLVAAALVPISIGYGSEIDFESDVHPILANSCLYCHGEDEQESGLRLDRRAFMLRGGDSGIPALVPGRPDKSYLVDVINHVDEDMAMPPDDDKLSDDKIQIITQWIREGASWPGQMDDTIEDPVDHWSLQPLQKSFDHNSIDAFLVETLDRAGLQLSPPSDPRSLIRRVSIVLTGMTPTPKRTQAFIESSRINPERAYVELVDELLSSSRFGERWAQHWLDVIRWAETNGSESNLYRKNAWMYRDYVVRAFNEDKPYDQFVREQIAGDVLGHGDATGFLVAGPHVPAATVGQEPSAIRQARADRMDEVLQTVGASVMGMTIGCARCHNHKFDPISIQDYYSLSAVFQDVEFGSRYPELNDKHPRVVRERELRLELESLREQMRSRGWAWTEDWTGYQEVHFPPKNTSKLRIAFDGRWVKIDELEILESGPEERNVLAPDSGAAITDNPETHVESHPPEKLNNGVFGTKGWRGVSKKGNSQKPWLEFEFADKETIGTIRISSNREDFLQTDYLDGMNKIMFGEFRLQLPAGNDKWQTFASTAAMKKRSESDPERAKSQEQIQGLISELRVQGPQPAFLAEFIDPSPTYVLARGSPESPRDRVHPAAPKNLGGEIAIPHDRPGPERRNAFADWLVSETNPLTARVIANRLWHHIFGQGIVATPSDFGRAGAPPTHPKLLDWLAGRVIENDWSMKETIRLIVLSRAFRQSSRPIDNALKRDGASQLLWRFPPRRVEAEVIRDSILQAAGTLDDTVGGPSYRIHNVKKRYAQWEVIDNYSDTTWRRMLYQERMRRVDDRIFTAFDFPDCGQIRAKRPVSTTPLQALNLMNSDFVVRQSKILADRARRESGSNVNDQVNCCFQLLLNRNPDNDERDSAARLVQTQSLELLCRTLINTNEFAFLP